MVNLRDRGMQMSTQSHFEERCFICQKHKGEIKVPGGAIYEDDLVYVGHVHWEEDKTYLGYIMIDIKRHTPGLAELTEKEAKAFGLIISRVSRALKECEGAEHIYAFVSGNGVNHMHMHIIPRYPNTPKEFWSPTKVANWEGAPYGQAEQIQKLCERIRTYMVNEYAYNK
ncbi:HIT family protein [Bacillus pseudomycoides]|uniref:HIT family protein n=2 Tax=Bacillus pseudomycoides TaxID=64104 RepID=A0A2A8C766_9BACI|nr:HIT family protein [Bacillus pseudomycoides]PEM70222.1 HIT family protein [Bacillus pseudomycoides]PFZ11602.1 HIT family protein [Bacillus pseudomycoides]PFZ11985.1 HIT family protein [Bacillus pseudomycoides]PGC51220.1 HIT family protein [Bacillus pseudomycoides]